MTRAAKVLDVAEIQTDFESTHTPQTIEGAAEKVDAVFRALEFLERKQGNRSPGLAADYRGLLDLCDYIDLQKGQRQTVDKHDDYPRTDPLTLLALARDYRVFSAEKADSLSEEFMSKAGRAAGGIALTEKQIRALYKLFREFDPVAHLAEKAPDPS